MKSAGCFSSWDEAREFLGDKLLGAWAAAVSKAAVDLAEYRSALPSQAAALSPRGLASVINDWLWAHLRSEVDEMAEAVITEQGPRREMMVRNQIRIRLKRHHGTGAIATYPTDEARRFYRQDEQLGSEQFVLFDDFPNPTSLVFGYVWDRELEEIGAATVSYPISRSKSRWVHKIGSATPPALPISPRPEAPKPTLRPVDSKHRHPAKPG